MTVRTLLAACIISYVCLCASAQSGSPCSGCSIPLYYDAVLARKGFPSPLIHMRVGEQEAVFIVDTGASVNTIASWFALELGLDIQDSNSSLNGSTGSETKIRVVSNLSGMLDNRVPVTFDKVIVVDFPPIFSNLRLAGLISPQLLTNHKQAGVLDMRVPNFTFESFARAQTSLGILRSEAFHRLRTCVNRKSAFVNRQYSVEANVSGIKGVLLVDSGATRTVVTAQSPIGQSLATQSVEGSESQGVGGAALKNRTAPNIEIHLAGSDIHLDSMTIGGSASSCGPDGLLGMDVLRSCVLILSPSTAILQCDKTFGEPR